MTTIKQAVERKDADIAKVLHPLIKEWFFSKFKEFSPTQRYGVLNVWERKNTLISAPTGGTKTLTSFLSILNYLVGLAEKNELEDKVYAIYTSPLKALSNDIHKNLVEPLEEIYKLAESKGIKLQEIRVGLRTGDTSQKDKAKMARKAPHIFLTTPESLAIVLTSSKFVEKMRGVEFCVVDEIHALDNKRGTYLSITLERLNEASAIWPVKIGLSATIEPLEEVAKFLVGIAKDREVEIANVMFSKKIDIAVLTPGDLIEDQRLSHNMYEKLHELIKAHKTTLIFTNTRSATERVVHTLKEKFPTEYGEDTDNSEKKSEFSVFPIQKTENNTKRIGNIGAHHSSLSRTHRFNIEERLRKGELKCVVTSTSLELGIDIGYIDLVIMLGSPKSSARALQRAGRSGHKLHDTVKARFVVMDRDDLVESAIIQKEIVERKINRTSFPRNCLDVLSQQIYGMAIYKVWGVNELLETLRKSYCFSELTKDDFFSVISYLSGEYAGLEEQHVYGKIWYDKDSKQIGKRGKLARVVYLTNIGTIPEESYIEVKLAPSGEHIGYIDEGFMERMKKGDVFVLGGSSYMYLYTRGMNLYVRGGVTRAPTIPSWFSEMLPLSFDSALEINRFRSLMREKFEAKNSEKEIIEFINKHVYTDSDTSKVIYDYFYEQFRFSEIPDAKRITIERYNDGSKKYVLVNSMYGRRVNDALSRALGWIMGSYGNRDVEIGISDNGFYFAGDSLNMEKALKELNPETIKSILEEAVNHTDILARRFRHCAGRALMILRTYKGKAKSVGKQHIKSHFLLHAVNKISKDFPILKEARREVLEDLMDINNTRQVLSWIKEGKLKTVIKDVRLPSPFSLNLILQGHSDLIRIEDKQAFLKRMHELHKKSLWMKDEDVNYEGL